MELFTENFEKPITEWLITERIFKCGKQGLVGILKSKDDERIKYVFKISRDLNYLIKHESSIIKDINKTIGFVPHFPKVYGIVCADTDRKKIKKGNPFLIENGKGVEKDVLLMENIENSEKFCSFFENRNNTENPIYSVINQTLASISIAQKKLFLTHYDLHSDNILVSDCDKDLVYLYIIDSDTQFCVPSFGKKATIIDYGFSFSKGTLGENMWCSLNHTDIGLLSDRFDPVADSKLFLYTVADEIHGVLRNKKSKILRNISRNLFSCLNLQEDSGWDNFTKKCAPDDILDKLENISKKSGLFSKNIYGCIEIIQSLIKLPLGQTKTDSLEISYITFIKEFLKIEDQVKNNFDRMFILKSIVDTSREVYDDYLCAEKKDKAVQFFSFSVKEKIDSIINFCKLDHIHYEKMLCGILCFAKCFEGELYKYMESHVKVKEDIYNKMPCGDIDKIIEIIQYNINFEYTFSEKTKIQVIDMIKNKTYFIDIEDKDINKINKTPECLRGKKIYKMKIE